MNRQVWQRGAAGCLGLAAVWAALGCEPSGSGPNTFRGIEAAERYAGASPDRHITGLGASAPMVVDGNAVGWEEVLPRLGEAAGGLIAEELALERLLSRAVADRGLAITETDLDRERGWLRASLAGSAVALAGRPDQNGLVTEIRKRRGLGPVRYEALLRRNAMLRALVADRIEVREEQVELAWRVQHGERVRVRVLVVPDLAEAQRLRGAALAGDGNGLEWRLAELAQQYSTDSSGPRGGLIEPFSTEDPAYEHPIRQAAAFLEPGQVSPAVAIRNGYAIVYLDHRLPADGVTLDAAHPALTEQLRQRQERLLMDQLATQLLAEARITIPDPSMSWSVRATGGR